jgi:holo-[acyl-carrier protein] synthase
MIVGVGLDAVEIVRFQQWHLFPPKMLARIFSEQEIEYCLSSSTKSAERFAVRFAAREAFFKAISSMKGDKKLSFLTVCKKVAVATYPNGAPLLEVEWDFFSPLRPVIPLLTLTHTATTATALVIITQIV